MSGSTNTRRPRQLRHLERVFARNIQHPRLQSIAASSSNSPHSHRVPSSSSTTLISSPSFFSLSSTSSAASHAPPQRACLSYSLHASAEQPALYVSDTFMDSLNPSWESIENDLAQTSQDEGAVAEAVQAQEHSDALAAAVDPATNFYERRRETARAHAERKRAFESSAFVLRLWHQQSLATVSDPSPAPSSASSALDINRSQKARSAFISEMKVSPSRSLLNTLTVPPRLHSFNLRHSQSLQNGLGDVTRNLAAPASSDLPTSSPSWTHGLTLPASTSSMNGSDEAAAFADDAILVLESNIDLNELICIQAFIGGVSASSSSSLTFLPHCPINSFIFLLQDGFYVEPSTFASISSLLRPARSLVDTSGSSASSRWLHRDPEELMFHTTVILSLHSRSRSIRADLDESHYELTNELRCQLLERRRVDQHGQRKRCLHEMIEAVSIEHAAIVSQRHRTRDLRRAIAKQAQQLSARMLLLERMSHAYPRLAAALDLRTLRLRDVDTSLAARRRKLLYHLSLLFPIVPISDATSVRSNILKSQERRKRRLLKSSRLLGGSSHSQSPTRDRNGQHRARPGNDLTLDDNVLTSSSSSSSSSASNSALSLSLTGHLPAARDYRICDALLPPFTSLVTASDEQVSTALGLIALAVSLISKYTNISTRYRLCFRGSRSTLIDECEDFAQPVYPLYARNIDVSRFQYGVYLLNQNIEYLLNQSVRNWQANIQVNANTGEKLKLLMEGLIGCL